MTDRYGFANPLDQSSLGAIDVYADIVYCIDLTSSMRPIINKVKETAVTLHDNLQKKMRDSYSRSIKQLRVKVIGFRDAYCDGELSFEVSDFFYLPEEAEEFKHFVDRLEAKGGGDLPENALEAIAMAMQSDWCTTLDSSVRKRHIIVLFTDAPAHELEQSKDGIDENYPENMPKSYSELMDMWYGQGIGVTTLNQIAKRMAVYAPKTADPWNNLLNDFNMCKVYNIEANKGGSDITTEDLLTMLGETMAG